jgi:L-threonylcarbamoyladenylate synthase
MKEEIRKCLDVLNAGGCILYPTDTIWGIGCDATDPIAVSKVYEIKKRVDSKAMLVLVDSIDMIYDYIEKMPEMALDILEQVQTERSGSKSDRSGAKPGSPLTIIYPRARGLAQNLVADDGSIGIRITTDEFSRELIRSFGKPLVSSSANTAGNPPPSNFSEISEEIQGSADHIANWKRDDKKKRKPSGILKVSINGTIEVIRQY